MERVTVAQGAAWIIERPVLNSSGAAADLSAASAYFAQVGADGVVKTKACAKESNVVSAQVDTSEPGTILWEMRIWMGEEPTELDRGQIDIIPAMLAEKPVEDPA